MLKLLSFVLVSFLVNPVFSCDSSALKKCFNMKRGIACYKKHKCLEREFKNDFCKAFDYHYCLKRGGGIKCKQKSKMCKDLVIRNSTNVEGFLSVLHEQDQIGRAPVGCHGIQSEQALEPGANFVDQFLQEADLLGQGVKTYKLGNYQSHKTDCSGYLMLAMKKMGLAVKGPQFDLAPNYPTHFKKCDPNNLKPGDLLLLNKPGRSPDHWIMVSSKGKWPSGDIEIMDVSSDYYGGKPYFKGKLQKRGNIKARKVFSCVRHKKMDQALGVASN